VEEIEGKNRTMSFWETRRLFEWGFEHFSRKPILSINEHIREAEVTLSRKMNYVTLHPAKDLDALLPNHITADDLERTVTLYQDPIPAPIAAGDVLGKITLSYNGRICGETELVASSDVPVSKLLVFKQQLSEFFSRTWVKITAIVLVVLLLLLLIWRLSNRRSSRYGGRRNYHTGGRRNYRGRRR